MYRRLAFLIIGITLFACCTRTIAELPLPLHSIEGNSGVFITNTAYLANPPEKEEVFGQPSVSMSGVFFGEKDLQSVAITENILGKFEIGYAYERFGLGDWPDDVKTAAGAEVDHALGLHNLNLRTMLFKETDLMPALTFGTHFKWNESTEKLDDDLGGLLDTLGSDRNQGTEFTLVASKTFPDLLPKPVIISAGLRNSDAVHTGLVGFAGERETTFEGSIIAFLNEKLVFAAEYRQKPDFIDQYSAGGYHLVKAENDWWTLCLGYVVNKDLTISGGYANLGNIFNHQEKQAWAIQIKYEF